MVPKLTSNPPIRSSGLKIGAGYLEERQCTPWAWPSATSLVDRTLGVMPGKLIKVNVFLLV